MGCNFTLFCFLAVMLSDHRALCDYVVEVNLRSYNNPESRAGNDGECCDPAENSNFSNDGICTEDELCDNFFISCLRPFNTLLTETSGCITPPIVTTNIPVNDDSLDFTSTDFGVPINPLTWTVNGSWQNGIQLYVVVVDNDNDGTQDQVDTFTIELGLNRVMFTNIEGNQKHGMINLTAEVYCEQCQFIDVCERDSITCSGSGVCVKMMNNYPCVCNGDFMGDCELINYCFDNPCNRNGTCSNEESSYICDCNPGYTGTICETNIDECDGQNCSGKGLCMDGINSYACACFAGYTGVNCSTNVDDCEFQNCTGNGECMDGIYSYTCVCFAGYTGDNCSTNIDDCEFQNCTGNGECMDEINSYACVCFAGYTGDNCSTNIDDCEFQNCTGNGECMDEINSYACVCFAGYTGDNCSTNIDDCEFQNCSRSGECMDGINSYICVCNTGFTGMNCETNIDDCVNQDCNGLGTCIDGVNSFSCNCDPPFTGSLCERIDYCYGVNCNRNGRCVNEQTNFTCKCNPGFTGELCSMDMQSNGVGDGVVIEALLGGVTAALLLQVLVIILLLAAIAYLVKKKNSINTTYFPNGEMCGDNQVYGIPDNSLEQTTSTNLTNTGTMRSDIAEFENTLYDSVQLAEVNNPDDEDIDLKDFSL